MLPAPVAGESYHVPICRASAFGAFSPCGKCFIGWSADGRQRSCWSTQRLTDRCVPRHRSAEALRPSPEHHRRRCWCRCASAPPRGIGVNSVPPARPFWTAGTLVFVCVLHANGDDGACPGRSAPGRCARMRPVWCWKCGTVPGLRRVDAVRRAAAKVQQQRGECGAGAERRRAWPLQQLRAAAGVAGERGAARCSRWGCWGTGGGSGGGGADLGTSYLRLARRLLLPLRAAAAATGAPR